MNKMHCQVCDIKLTKKDGYVTHSICEKSQCIPCYTTSNITHECLDDATEYDDEALDEWKEIKSRKTKNS